jgi:TPP-dependent 2-oxoacid decarboxylase
MPTLGKSLLQGLKDHGARELFGIPGDFVLPFFKVIEESGILPHYTLSHEPAVGFAADAAARYHSSIGVAGGTEKCAVAYFSFGSEGIVLSGRRKKDRSGESRELER